MPRGALATSDDASRAVPRGALAAGDDALGAVPLTELDVEPVAGDAVLLALIRRGWHVVAVETRGAETTRIVVAAPARGAAPTRAAAR